MATDSTELTFVRCHSCRSLVPAISTKCKMCGAALNSEEDLAQDSDEESGETNGKAELKETVDRIQSDIEAVQDDLDSDEASAAGSEEEEIDDPLGDYLDDLSDDDSDEVESEEDDSDDDDAREEKSAEEPHVNGHSREAEPEDSEDEDDAEEETPRVVRESGRPKGRGLSFGKKGDASAPQEKKASQSEPKRERPEPKQAQRPPEPKQAKPQPKQVRKPHQQTEQPQRQEERAQSQERTERAPKRRGADLEGRLFGWLVSYADAEGEAIELREGKFFVSGRPIRENDLVIEDDSVSAPHAIITVSASKGLLIQDLMSEEGVHVRRGPQGEFTQEEEVAEVHHGDWVRFGQVEFLVSLVAHVGQ